MDFSLSPALIIMNIAYVLNLVGLAVKNILILRILLMSAQIILIYTGYVRGNWIVMFWNAVFLVINLLRTIMLLLERRPVKLPAEVLDIYRENFLQMTEREFLRFWDAGKTVEITGGHVVRSGENADSVYIIIGGSATVRNRTGTVAILRRGGFIGEMSYISGRPPSADVMADSVLTLRAWKRTDLNSLRIRDHAQWVKMQQALGRDLVMKVNRMSDKSIKQAKGLLGKASVIADGQN